MLENCIKCNQPEAGASWGSYCSRCVNNALLSPDLEKELRETIASLNQELTTEREITQQALRRGEEWHNQQKAEIIEVWKGKLTTYRNQRKTSLQAEIQLIKEALHE